MGAGSGIRLVMNFRSPAFLLACFNGRMLLLTRCKLESVYRREE
jgi:hypothetical protein